MSYLTIESPFWGVGFCDLRKVHLSSDQKFWLGSMLNDKIITNLDLQKRFMLPESTLRRFGKQVKDGVTLNVNGRPSLLSVKYQKQILNELSNGKYKKRGDDFRKDFMKLAQLSAEERGYSPAQVTTPDKSTIWRFERDNKIKTANAEVATNARIVAVNDKRNIVSFLALNHFLNEQKINSKLIINSDATQFTVGYDDNGKVKVKYIGPRPKTLKAKPLTKSTSDITFNIKYFLLMSAFGFQGNPVFIIADKNMTDDEFDPYEVPGLGVGTDFTLNGYVVFCATRCCNEHFFMWYNENILIPYIKNIKDKFKLPDNTLSYYSLDGEPVQIKCFSDPQVLDTFEKNSVVVVKPPASTTAATQPCDAGNCFKGPKTTIKAINDSMISDNNDMIEYLNTNVIEVHCSKYSSTNSPMSYQHKHMAVHGLLKVQLALQMSMNRNTIRKSFDICGIYPYNSNKMLAQCSAKFTLDEQNLIFTAVPNLAPIIGTKGELTNEDFDAFNIPNNGGDKDNLVIYRRRTVILTNTELFKREQNKKAELEAKKDTKKRKQSQQTQSLTIKIPRTKMGSI